MQVLCPTCKQKLNVPDSALGKKIRCPKCQAVVPVPAAPEPAIKTTPPPSPKPSDADEDSALGAERKRRKKKKKKAAAGLDKRILIGVGAGGLMLVIILVVAFILTSQGQPQPQGFNPALPGVGFQAAKPEEQGDKPAEAKAVAALRTGLVFDEPLPLKPNVEKQQPWAHPEDEKPQPVQVLLPAKAAGVKKEIAKEAPKDSPTKEPDTPTEGERLPPRAGDRTGLATSKAKPPEQWTKPAPPPQAERLIGAVNVPNTQAIFASAHVGFLAWWTPPESPRDIETLRWKAKTNEPGANEKLKNATQVFKGLRWHRYDLRTGQLTGPAIKLGGLGSRPYGTGPHFDPTTGTLAAAISNDATSLAVRDPWDSARIDVWDLDGKPLLAMIPYGADTSVQWIGWSARGRLLTMGGGKLTAWDVTGGKAIFELEGDYQLPVRIVRGGAWLAAPNGADIDLVDADTGACLGRCATTENEHDLTSPRDLAISPDGSMLACVAWRKTPDSRGAGILESWDLASGKANPPVRMRGLLSRAVFALDSRRVLLGGGTVMDIFAGAACVSYQPVRFKTADFMPINAGPMGDSPDGRLWAFGPDPADEYAVAKEQKWRIFVRPMELPGYETVPSDPRVVFTKQTPLTVVVDLGNDERNRAFGLNLMQSLQGQGFTIGKGGWTLRATCEVKPSETNLKMKGWAGGFVNVPIVHVSWTLYAPDGELAHKTGIALQLGEGSKYYKGSRVVSKTATTIEMEWTWEFPDRNPREAITNELLEGVAKRGDVKLVQGLAKFEGKYEITPILKNAVLSPWGGAGP